MDINYVAQPADLTDEDRKTITNATGDSITMCERSPGDKILKVDLIRISDEKSMFAYHILPTFRGSHIFFVQNHVEWFLGSRRTKNNLLVNLHTGAHYDITDEYLWINKEISTNGNLLHVDGHVWGKRWFEKIYDMSNIAHDGKCTEIMSSYECQAVSGSDYFQLERDNYFSTTQINDKVDMNINTRYYEYDVQNKILYHVSSLKKDAIKLKTMTSDEELQRNRNKQ